MANNPLSIRELYLALSERSEHGERYRLRFFERKRQNPAKLGITTEKRDTQLEISVIMESYPVNQCDNQEPESGEPQEATENRKEMLHHSSKRKGSPRNQQRNYRRRSFSESPERSPERSKEQSPVSRRQNRHSDQGDYHRYRRSRSRSRSRSPRRRRRSHSPRNERDETSDQAKEGKHSQSLGKIPSEREKAQQLSVRRGSNTQDEEDMEKSPPRGKTARSKSSDRDSSSPQRRNSPKRRSKTPDQRRRRSPCRERRVSCERKSPERFRRRDNRKSPQRDSRDRRSSGDYSRRHERDRDRARNREREGRGGRDWGRDRRYDRDRDGDRDRNRERDRDRSREDEKVASPGQDKKTFVKATSTGQLETLPRPARPLTSEEVQAKLAAHAESLRKQAQDAASMLNLPSYLNPSVVNPHQYAVQAQKRKLLWSGKKTTEATASTSSSVPKSTMWNSTTFSNDQGGEMQAKFRRLMGIKGEGNATTTGEVTQPQNQKLMDDLEKEFERSRAFQLSRGAGGKSGIGLGYSGT